MRSGLALVLVALVLVALATRPAVAQEAHHAERPYAGLEERTIKALSAEERRELLEGEGMGLALAAELNGYPGPKHVLELADSLALDAEQRERVEAVRRRMRERAVELGRQVVEAEQALDSLFASGAATAPEVEARAEAIGRLRGRLRAVHLTAHLETRRLLTLRQARRYDRLRGYAGEHDRDGAHRHEEGDRPDRP